MYKLLYLSEEEENWSSRVSLLVTSIVPVYEQKIATVTELKCYAFELEAVVGKETSLFKINRNTKKSYSILSLIFCFILPKSSNLRLLSWFS